MSDEKIAADPEKGRRLFVYNGGFLTQQRLRRILQLAGYSLHLGLPKAGDGVAVWGNAGTAHRGQSVAARTGAPLVRIEDAFLRSVHPGRGGEPPLGLLIDQGGLHFDPATVSDLEQLLSTHPFDDPALLARAEGGMARIREERLSKYTAFDTDIPAALPDRFVLVIDQTVGDASVQASKADRQTFLDMLARARQDHPGVSVLIKTHPETTGGLRPGHFTTQDAGEGVHLLSTPVAPQHLFERAKAVYTVSSQLGFEAILAGHKPHVMGQPFYAGWGLSIDDIPLPRRVRKLSAAQLFAAAMILYPTWYDPYRDCLCRFEDALETLAAQTRAWRQDHRGWVASGMRLWKRKPLQGFFGTHVPMRFMDAPSKAAAMDRPWMVWAGKATAEHNGAVRVEDGFLRSKGLGATLVPPMSLVCDDLGIYYDPARPSRLEDWIAQRAKLRPDQKARVSQLIERLCDAGLSKYNLDTAPLAQLHAGKRILVPGQVEDDASIRLGTDAVSSNRALLTRVRQENPDAVLLFKPHPDVEAGLRPGGIDAKGLADQVITNADPVALLAEVDAVWTMTSLLGFEALIRSVPVTTLGAPFYAGWGLTQDLGKVPARRRARPALAGLVHASLIDYPRYRDPKTGLACPVEVVVDRLAEGFVAHPGKGNRLLSKLQGLFASRADLWRG